MYMRTSYNRYAYFFGSWSIIMTCMHKNDVAAPKVMYSTTNFVYI